MGVSGYTFKEAERITNLGQSSWARKVLTADETPIMEGARAEMLV